MAVMDNGDWSAILLVGADVQSNHEVSSRLGELCGQKLSTQDAEQTPVLKLQTKYYTAPVELHAQQVQLNALTASSKALPHLLHEFEAIICVVDAESEESFLHVHKYVQDLLEEHPAFDVCLMVSLPSTAASNKSASHRQRLEQWCQDNEFELVNALDAAEAGENQEDAGNETRGMERVLEALHCQMWRSMVMGGPASFSSTQADNDAIAAVEIVSGSSAAAVEEPVATEASSPVQDEDRLESLFRGLEMAGPSSGMDDDGEMDMHAFSSLIDEVRRVRENGQSLTDEERRQQAAAVAMRLWNLLGSDEEGDDTDDE